MNMLLVAEGAERTGKLFKRLLDRTGFELREIIPTPAVSSVIRARAI